MKGHRRTFAGGRKQRRWERLRRQLAEACETARIVAAFVAFSALLGLANESDIPSNAAGALRERDGTPESLREQRPSPAEPMRSTTLRMRVAEGMPELWLIDGFNVLNVAILRGSERDDFWGPPARERLLDLVRQHSERAQIVVVFDGPEPLERAVADPAAERVVFAEDADEWLLRQLGKSGAPERVSVVTADRRLAARARHRGARVVAPGRFVAECRETGTGTESGDPS